MNFFKKVQYYVGIKEMGEDSQIKDQFWNLTGMRAQSFSHPGLRNRDNTGNNISFKNPNYGEYSFHYWIWKNYLHELKDNWIGFCQYRRFWSFNQNENISKFENFCKVIVKSIPEEYHNYDVILGNPMFINQFRLSKFIKKNFESLFAR